MNTLVNMDEDEYRTTAVGLARFAYEYIDAAMLVDHVKGGQQGFEHVSPIPAYFLAMHGVELTFKAYLRHQGVEAKALRSRELGHDIRACYRKSKELGLRHVYKMRADDLRAMLLLLELNEFQGLRYIRTGFKRFPSWAIVEPFAVRLHQAVAPLVGYHSFAKSYQT